MQENQQRLSKVIALSGYCSRRQAEVLICQGKVKVNGVIVNSVPSYVGLDDKILIEDKLLCREKIIRLWCYHKPANELVTHNDTRGRKTIYDSLRGRVPSYVCAIGRLDYKTEGLLLLTNHGPLARFYEHPKNGFKRIYKVITVKSIGHKAINKILSGITISGINYKPIKIQEIKQKDCFEYLLTLTEGKNREIRKIFAYFHCSIKKLIRISYGSLSIKGLASGEVREECQSVIPDFEKHTFCTTLSTNYE